MLSKVFADTAAQKYQSRVNFKGVWIPREFWEDPDLRRNRLLRDLLIQIFHLSQGRGCTASNRYFSEFFFCTKSNISQAIHKLQDMGYVHVVFRGPGTKFGRVIFINYQKLLEMRTEVVQSSVTYDEQDESELFEESQECLEYQGTQRADFQPFTQHEQCLDTENSSQGGTGCRSCADSIQDILCSYLMNNPTDENINESEPPGYNFLANRYKAELNRYKAELNTYINKKIKNKKDNTHSLYKVGDFFEKGKKQEDPFVVFLSNPLFEENRNLRFPDLSNREIENYVRTFVQDYPKCKFFRLCDILEERNKQKSGYKKTTKVFMKFRNGEITQIETNTEDTQADLLDKQKQEQTIAMQDIKPSASLPVTAQKPPGSLPTSLPTINQAPKDKLRHIIQFSIALLRSSKTAEAKHNTYQIVKGLLRSRNLTKEEEEKIFEKIRQEVGETKQTPPDTSNRTS